ncbi:substrate-binding domain-containing protein [Methylobacterium sp. NMS14P]|uniref:substrate-binding domain-containing protein n=1 Tax=Methylobacterium sp. NMS14P TaxID=2894310 RepID=UPI002358DBE1|nr:substrate-binding domain-containing protein [Methylobacterium sp. NMS14P]WCS25445.1 substrate-binding domain-containing protein [Methylobacterium sp. NMS14P]
MSSTEWARGRFIGGSLRTGTLVLALGAWAFPASAATIAILTPPAAAARRLHDGLDEHARARGVEARFAEAPEGAGEVQIAQVRKFIAAKVDALVVMPVDLSAREEITRLALEADVPLVLIGQGPRADWFAGRVTHVVPHDLVAGRLQMRKLAQMLGGTGRVALIAGSASDPASVLRQKGARDVLSVSPGLRLVAETTADGGRAPARAAVAGWLTRGLGIDVIAAGSDEMALGAAEAVEAAGIPAGRILIGGVDATADGMQAMQDKRLAVTIYQDAGTLSRRAVDDALALIRREPVPHVDGVPCELVTDRMSTTHFAR